MIDTLDQALIRAQKLLLTPDQIRRICFSGRARGADPKEIRIDIRPVILKSILHWQVVSHDGKRDTTKNIAIGELSLKKYFSLGYSDLLIQSATNELQLRLTKSGDANISIKKVDLPNLDLSHDRIKERLLPPDDAIFIALGISDQSGKLKPSKSDKFTQVQEFLKIIKHSLEGRAQEMGSLNLLDLGCGHAYLTLAAHRYLSNQGYQVQSIGVDEREESRSRNVELVERLGLSKDITFKASKIEDFPHQSVDIVIALHACDTASDDAISWAVKSQAEIILIAPCCHHDIQKQMKSSPKPWNIATKHGIINQRIGDIITDSIRACILKIMGYRTDIIEFIAGEHTPRNLMIRAIRSVALAQIDDFQELDQICTQWKIEPALNIRLKDELSVRLTSCQSQIPQAKS